MYTDQTERSKKPSASRWQRLVAMLVARFVAKTNALLAMPPYARRLAANEVENGDTRIQEHDLASLQQAIRSEQQISPFRLLALVSSAFIYFLALDKSHSDPNIAMGMILFIALYSIFVHIFQPFQHLPFVIWTYFITVTDGLLTSLWIYATGGYNSPFYLIYYVCIIAVAVRHGVKGTLLAATLYAAFYVTTLLFLPHTPGENAEILTRIIYIFMAGGITLIATNQVQAKSLELRRANAILKEKHTIRQQAEEALHQSKERLRFTLEAARVGTWSWDQQSNQLEFSDNLARVLGIPAHALTTSIASLHSHVLPEDQAKIASAVISSKDNGGRYSIEFRVQQPDGKLHWIEEKAIVVLGASGLPESMSGVDIDISERKHLELEDHLRTLQQIALSDISRMALEGQDIDTLLLTAVESLRSILEVMRVTVWQRSIVGEERSLRAVADSMTREGTHDPRLMTNMSFSLAVPIPAVKGNYGDLVISSDHQRHFSQDDTQFIHSMVNLLAAAIDRKRLQDELVKRIEELADADKRKDEFLAMLAHELRNPLAPIFNALAIMEQGHEDHSRDARRMIERQIRHLTNLVDDLLDVSRVTRGKITLKKESLDINQVILKAIETCQPLIGEKNQIVQLSLSTDPILVHADATRLEQIMTNLINNAAKYSDPGRNIWISTEENDGQVILSVKDQGIGMTPDMLARVFDLFAQADGTLDRARGGLGIGLTLVKSIVDLHRWHIDVHSDGLDKGTDVRIRMPVMKTTRIHGATKTNNLQEAKAKPLPAIIESVSNSNINSNIQVENKKDVGTEKLRILVVDDSPDAAEFLSVLLEMWGYEVHVTNDGPSALEAVKLHHPDLVLLDIGLPGMDGYQVARSIRTTLDSTMITLVALTGYGRVEDRHTALKAGFDHHMVKPIHPDELKKFLLAVAVKHPANRDADSHTTKTTRPNDELTLH